VGTAPQPTDEVAAAADGAVRASGTSRILPNTVYRATADVGSKLISVGFFVVMARMLGDQAFGAFTFGLSFAALVTVLAGFGQDAILTREVARDRRRVHEYFANTVAIKLVLALPVMAAAVLGLSLVHIASVTRIVAILISVAVLAELLATTCFAVFQAFERLDFLPVVIIAQRLFTAAVGIGAMAFGAGIEAVAAIYLGGSLLALAIATWLLLRRIVRPRLAIDVSHWWPLMRVAFPVGVALVFEVTLFRVDASILQIFEPQRVVGHYGAAYRLFESPLFISWAVAAAVYPVLSRLAATRDLRTVAERSLKLAVASTLPVALGAAILAGPVVKLLYGSDFDSSARVLALLAPTIVLYSFNHVAGVLLLSRNRQRWLAWVFGVMAVENVAANFATIPSYGMTAAAVNTTVTEVLLFLALAALGQQLVGGLDWVRLSGGPLVAGAVAAALMVGLRGSFAAALATGLVGYVVALAIFERLAYPQDVRAVTRFLRRNVAPAA
jgi:O-antigen/teichoic acid export membrane protein